MNTREMIKELKEVKSNIALQKSGAAAGDIDRLNAVINSLEKLEVLFDAMQNPICNELEQEEPDASSKIGYCDTYIETVIVNVYGDAEMISPHPSAGEQ